MKKLICILLFFVPLVSQAKEIGIIPLQDSTMILTNVACPSKHGYVVMEVSNDENVYLNVGCYDRTAIGELTIVLSTGKGITVNIASVYAVQASVVVPRED